eukprot:TRINITY_DN985_c0_g1_i1.p1 TRINITY_DN985_c0_g1~~TRINITY_DN985_c0_g1_i1.p1  ORF type:complete len:151 (-),score=46.65 TRINITY_DN985_c0_g1_i1:176-628(-)
MVCIFRLTPVLTVLFLAATEGVSQTGTSDDETGSSPKVLLRREVASAKDASAEDGSKTGVKLLQEAEDVDSSDMLVLEDELEKAEQQGIAWPSAIELVEGQAFADEEIEHDNSDDFDHEGMDHEGLEENEEEDAEDERRFGRPQVDFPEN